MNILMDEEQVATPVKVAIDSTGVEVNGIKFDSISAARDYLDARENARAS